jgi:DNA-binding XRE family transcriptional regulator
MKTAKDYWTPIFNDFIQRYPELAEKIIDWYPSGQMEITVKIKGGEKYLYDWQEQLVYLVHASDEQYAVNEEEWRIRFAKKLQRKLNCLGMTQEALAFNTGISLVTISKYINGKATPSGYNIQRIASALQCSYSELMY